VSELLAAVVNEEWSQGSLTLSAGAAVGDVDGGGSFMGNHVARVRQLTAARFFEALSLVQSECGGGATSRPASSGGGARGCGGSAKRGEQQHRHDAGAGAHDTALVLAGGATPSVRSASTIRNNNNNSGDDGGGVLAIADAPSTPGGDADSAGRLIMPPLPLDSELSGSCSC
jgi:hypothetical protein